VGIAELLSRLIEETAVDAEALGCADEVRHCRTIIERGSSADCQLGAWRDSGGDIAAVSRWIASKSAPSQARYASLPA
jgi:glutamate---cysteine ligase / carboxylate-amine ligase